MRKYFLSFLLALSLHLGIIGLFVMNISTDMPVASKPKKVQEIIEATILDETVVEAKAQELRQQQENKKQAQQKQKDDVARQLTQEKKRLQQAKNRRLLEEKLAKKQAEKRKKVAQEEQKKLQAIKQKVALEKKKRQQQEQQRFAEEKKQAQEKKRKAEAERVAEENRQIEAEKQEATRIEAEKQEKIAQEKRQRENEENLKIAAAQEAENASIARKASVDAAALIKRKVTQNWNRPGSVSGNMKCKIKIGLIPSGDVMSAAVVESSGNSLFDDSAVRAVYKASPLPVPKDPNVFKQFRNFTFLFAPN